MNLSKKISHFLAWATMGVFFIGLGVFNLQVSVDSFTADSSISISVQETQARKPVTNNRWTMKWCQGGFIECCSYKVGGRCKTGTYGHCPPDITCQGGNAPY